MDIADSTLKLGSIVQINSIAIDISSSMEAIESPVHEHFSIRGFVAEMRKKDWKTCIPFSSEGNDVDPGNNLPPLFVPEYRWWQCSSCIPNAEIKRTTEEMLVATPSEANTSSCEYVGGKDGLFIHRRENTGRKRKTDIRDTKAGNSCDTPEVNQQQVIERLNNTPDASDKSSLAERPPCVVDEPGNASSGSDGTFSVLPHRRKPKLRSLADIMVEERNQTSSNPRTRSASSCGMQVASTEMEEVLVPQIEVDVPADVAKAAGSLERKRKIALGEDREPLSAICPRASSKRIKDLVLDTEKSSRRVEISDPESKGGASMRLDLPRNQRIKPKKAKAIDISKKMTQIHRDYEIVQMREYLQPNAASSENLQEQALPMKTNLGKLGGAPKTLVEMRPCFSSSLSGQQTEKISDLSTAKMPKVGADDDPLMPPSKSIKENCNIRGKVALDLSLNSFMDAETNHNNKASFRERRCIPDLNVESPEKSDMTEGQQFTILSEKRGFLDAYASCSNETVREGKRQLGISELKNKDHNVELGASDDIPMEIVELLARNQLERALGNSRRHRLGINNSTRKYSAIDVDQHPGMINYPLPSRLNGSTAANGNMGVRPNISISFPQLNHCQLDTSKPEKSQFRLLSSSTPSQPRKPECSMSTSITAEPRSGTGVELLWSSARENVPFGPSIPHNRTIHPSGISAYSFLDDCHKRRPIGDMKDGKGKKAIPDVAKLKVGRTGSIYTSTGSLDPYSNDTIPAMQLLSLMDQRVKSCSSFEEGTKSSIDKPFSPCKHHPHLNGKENHSNILGGSFFKQNSNSKDFSWFRYGAYSSGESSKRPTSNLRVQVPQELRNPKTTLLDGSSDLEKQPARSNGALGDCTLNRNPADFSIPEVGNRFTLCAKDLKPRRRNALKEKSRAGNVDGRKRQIMRKNARDHDLGF
ncbi:embryonic flower 1 [Perilla frutescens var. hirtella]|uniref:Embryonic flower 1 n=1 Tax=Perilla frutescens var. hirtella TaxID=608512 RepID=A0AAD4PE11_PERFH|nr:embryonic flower 1 [Perilla frutescens var. hirtella]